MKNELITCPACKGKGVVDVQFEPNTPTWIVEAKFSREPCGPCNGTGLISKERVVRGKPNDGRYRK